MRKILFCETRAECRESKKEWDEEIRLGNKLTLCCRGVEKEFVDKKIVKTGRILRNPHTKLAGYPWILFVFVE